MKKIVLSVFLTGLLIIFGNVAALASSPVLLDGEFVDVEAVTVDGRTLLPIRALTETIGGGVDWNAATRQVTVVHGDTIIVLTIGSTTALVNDSAVTLDVPAQTIDGRTFLPLRFVGESLGLEIDFYAQTVIVSTSANTLSGADLRAIARVAVANRATTPPTNQSLIGTWIWMGSPYYVFESDGRGTMSGMDIRWSTRNGILSICSTPAICGNTCIALAEWDYVLTDNQLTLTSRLIPNLSFTYTRK